MDWLNVFFFVALIYFFSSIQKRRKNGRAPEDRTEEETHEPPARTEPRETPRRTRTESRPAPPPTGPAQGGYDYDAFRKKLRRAWKLDQPEEETTADESAAPARAEAPVPVQIERAPAPAAPPARDEAELARQRRYADYLRRTPAPAEPAAAAALMTEPAAPAQNGADRTWTERDVRQWMVYDAVFGEPRSRRPWQPLRGRRDGHAGHL